MNIAIVTLPWQLGTRGVAHGRGADAILNADLVDRLIDNGHRVGTPTSAELTPAEQKQYGAWHKTGLANNHFAQLIAEERREGNFVIGLESDCRATMGALAGIQQSGVERTRMVWLEACWAACRSRFPPAYAWNACAKSRALHAQFGLKTL